MTQYIYTGTFGATFLVLDQSQPSCSGACPMGYSCGVGTSEPILCPPASYCAEGSALPLPCPSGTYSANSGLSAVTQCQMCTLGHSCSIGVETPTICSSGSYGAAAGASDCTKCPAGKFQENDGQTTCNVCIEASYCQAGASQAVPCPANTHSPAGSHNRTQCLCKAEFLTQEAETANELSCVCPAGYAAISTSGSTTCNPCHVRAVGSVPHPT